jgi:hypothetical protein
MRAVVTGDGPTGMSCAMTLARLGDALAARGAETLIGGGQALALPSDDAAAIPAWTVHRLTARPRACPAPAHLPPHP